jgi:hypothetical protein
MPRGNKAEETTEGAPSRRAKHQPHRVESLRLILFCALVLLGASLAVRPFVAKKESFDQTTFASMRERNPEFVLIGDSLLGYSIDPALLQAQAGTAKVEVLWYPGAASAAWYLYLKNFIAAAGVHPRGVFIFIHDDVVTDPQFRTTGKYVQGLQRLRRDDEPLVRRLIKEDRNARWWLPRWVAVLFPADENRAHYQQKLDSWVRRAVTWHRKAARQLEADANATFDVSNVRADQPIVTTEERKPFDAAIDGSFLPHMIALARDGHYPLSFVRPKKRSGPYADFDDSEPMKQYYARLGSYLAANGCELIDFTHDPFVTSDMFSDAVHIGPWAKAAFTKHFAERLADRFR